MIPIKIKDETGAELTIDANSILCVCDNKSTNSCVRSLILFKSKNYGYLFSCEDSETILKRVEKAKVVDDVASALAEAMSHENKNDLTTY